MEEKIVTINLKKKVLKDPKWKRKKIIINEIKKLFSKKGEEIKIDNKLNEYIWRTGNTKLRILVKKEDKKITLSC
ncbi:MAG: 50S ribosomal protein L31e [Candidatus Aenigmarchaeota archaeon]|nr:50S ribosomal protein L31e [Candidatus Aenigmarchaeota archaeon]MDW8149469.1 50S ribosomal protein L31e [Candidatus Aenigmarchaeota archaeon]